jgi:site-specific recombinase XerD
LKEILETIEETISYEKYLQSLKTDATRKLYGFRLSQFFKLYETNFNEFLELARGDPKKCRHYVLDFLKKEKDRGISIGSLTCERFALRSILHYARAKEILPKQSYDIIDPDTWSEAIELGKRTTEAKDRLPTGEEIHNFLMRLDLRGKALIEFLTSCGARIGAIQSLKFKHIEPISLEGFRFAKVRIYADDKEEYYSFISQEAYETLEQYKKQREYKGEKITGESYVFINEGQRGDKYRPPCHQSLLIYFSKRWKEMGLRTQKEEEGEGGGEQQQEGEQNKKKKKRFEFPIFHWTRKWTKSKIESNGMKTLYSEMLLGHDIGLNKNYFRESPLDMARAYLRVMPYLG